MQKRSRWGERLALLVLAAALFMGCVRGGRALQALPDWENEDWQSTATFERLIYDKVDQVMILINSYLRLRTEGLPYVEKQQLETSVKEQLEELGQEESWFRFRIRSGDGQTVYWSNSPDRPLEEQVQSIRYALFEKNSRVPGEGVSFENYNGLTREPELQPLSPDHLADAILTVPPAPAEGAAAEKPLAEEDCLIIECGVPAVPEDSIRDDFYGYYELSRSNRANFREWAEQAAVLLGLAGLALLCFLVLSGRRCAGADYEPGQTGRIWLEVILLLAGGAGFLCVWAGSRLAEYVLRYADRIRALGLNRVVSLTFGGLGLALGLTAAVVLCTAVNRFCSHRLWTSTMLCRLWQLLNRGWRLAARALPDVWKWLLLFAVYCAANLVLLLNAFRSAFPMLLWLAGNILVLVLLCRRALALRRLREGARTIAAGNLNHQIDTAGMPADLQEHGELLNNISQGLSGAVDEKMKSERFKAELITNVSHDLKTPLTSIINYVSLLKTTDQTDPKAEEYIEVLDRKSQRLKKLTEDLVEASKASTGVLSVNREKIGAAQLLDQALGEWEEKLRDRKLTVVTSVPEGETWVYADGRHLWRVIDNLLSNCCKYAMEGTRVYLDLKRARGQVVLEVKNVSREPLNVPPERLMERFVRGETSRSTEGSGLGLSIARSLTEIQGGEFSLSVDGDLFKATVSLPQAT